MHALLSKFWEMEDKISSKRENTLRAPHDLIYQTESMIQSQRSGNLIYSIGKTQTPVVRKEKYAAYHERRH